MSYKWAILDKILGFLDASSSFSSPRAYLNSKMFDPTFSIQESLDEGRNNVLLLTAVKGSWSSHLPESHWDLGCPSDFRKQDFKAFQNCMAEKNK